jgi:DNA-binding response OmpR family regulator
MVFRLSCRWPSYDPGRIIMHTPSVLVVDDLEAHRYAMCRALEASGFRTVEAANGEQALCLAEGLDAAVVDVHLPQVDGFEVCRRLRSNPATALMPIIHVSAQRVTQADLDTGLRNGADAYLISPFDPSELVGMLQVLLRSTRG